MNRMSMLVAGAIVASASATAQAALVAYDGFNYTAGETISGKNGGTGWRVGENGGTWDAPTGGSVSSWDGSALLGAGGLSYTDSQGNELVTTGSANLVITGDSTSANRLYRENRPILDDGTLWISVIAQRTGNANAESIGFLQHSGWGGDVRFFGQTRSGSDWRLQGGTATGVNSANTAFLLIKWDRVSNAASLWVNPQLGDEAGLGAAQGTATWDPADGLRRIEFRADAGAGLILDEYRMGTTFADVTPFTAVPEPASLALLATAGLMAIRRRRQA